MIVTSSIGKTGNDCFWCTATIFITTMFYIPAVSISNKRPCQLIHGPFLVPHLFSQLANRWALPRPSVSTRQRQNPWTPNKDVKSCSVPADTSISSICFSETLLTVTPLSSSQSDCSAGLLHSFTWPWNNPQLPGWNVFHFLGVDQWPSNCEGYKYPLQEVRGHR